MFGYTIIKKQTLLNYTNRISGLEHDADTCASRLKTSENELRNMKHLVEQTRTELRKYKENYKSLAKRNAELYHRYVKACKLSSHYEKEIERLKNKE